MIYLPRMNKYELTMILDGKTGATKKKSQTAKITKIVEISKGKVLSEKEWGVRDLAYKIDKSETGLYLFFELELEPKAVRALNDKLRTDSDLLRYLLIKNG